MVIGSGGLRIGLGETSCTLPQKLKVQEGGFNGIGGKWERFLKS